MNELLERMQATPLALWVLESNWGYPILLVFHAIGLALLVGILTVIDLRILGIGRPLPLSALRRFMPAVWLGFWANALSGTLMFIPDAMKYYYSTTFRVKLLSVVLGVALTHVIGTRVSASGSQAREPDQSGRVRALAACSLLCWVSAIVTGRLVAYVS
jgi:hypothetical protein